MIEIAKFNAKIIKENFIKENRLQKIILRKKGIFKDRFKKIDFSRFYVLEKETFKSISKKDIKRNTEYYLCEFNNGYAMLNLLFGISKIRGIMKQHYDNVYDEDILKIINIDRKFFIDTLEEIREISYDYNYNLNDMTKQILESKEFQIKKMLTKKYINAVKETFEKDNQDFVNYIYEKYGKDCFSVEKILITFSQLSENKEFNNILWRYLFSNNLYDLDEKLIKKHILKKMKLNSTCFHLDLSKIIQGAKQKANNYISDRMTTENKLPYMYLKAKIKVDKE